MVIDIKKIMFYFELSLVYTTFAKNYPILHSIKRRMIYNQRGTLSKYSSPASFANIKGN